MATAFPANRFVQAGVGSAQIAVLAAAWALLSSAAQDAEAAYIAGVTSAVVAAIGSFAESPGGYVIAAPPAGQIIQIETGTGGGGSGILSGDVSVIDGVSAVLSVLAGQTVVSASQAVFTTNPTAPNLPVDDNSQKLITSASMIAYVTAALASQAAGAPVNTALPEISGSTSIGDILDASNGTWTLSPSGFTFQWQRSTNEGTTWGNIQGEEESAYTLAQADVGNIVRIQVVADGAAASLPSSSLPSAVIGGGNTPPTNITAPVITAGAPTNTALPTISGTAQQGQQLTATDGTWTGEPTTFAVQWLRNATNITGAAGTANPYTVQSADVGDTLTVQITASNGTPSTPATSTATATVISATAPTNTVLPVLSGTPTQGDALSVSDGTWTGSPTTWTFIWQGSPDGVTWTTITGQTGATYTLQAGDVGNLIRAGVTANNGANSAVAYTAPSPTIASSGAGPINVSPPTISGTPVYNGTNQLTGTDGSWTGTPTYTQQWQRSPDGTTWSNIAGSTGLTHTLAALDVGNYLRISVTATIGTASTTEDSDATALVTG